MRKSRGQRGQSNLTASSRTKSPSVAYSVSAIAVVIVALGGAELPEKRMGQLSAVQCALPQALNAKTHGGEVPYKNDDQLRTHIPVPSARSLIGPRRALLTPAPLLDWPTGVPATAALVFEA